MVRTDSKTEKIQNLYQRNTDTDFKDGGNGIGIESSFQRGDEETGVWTSSFKQNYIDSLQKGYPSGIITFVKDHKCATAYQEPWKVLDGGNRMRAIRDYIDCKYVDLNGMKYSQLSPQDQADFNTILIPCQEITIERNDNAGVISDMFIRLNTKTNPLKQGELFKAHGHRSDIYEIEMAKKIIGHTWTAVFQDDFKVNDTINIKYIRELWVLVFGDLKETPRCDNLAMLVGYIVSARTENFTLFDKRYKNLSRHLSDVGAKPSHEDYGKIYSKIFQLLEIVNKITDKSIFGKIIRGVPPQTKISPVWKKICEGTLTQDNEIKMIHFYNSLSDNTGLKREYLNLFKGSNSETDNTKIQKIIDFVLADHD